MTIFDYAVLGLIGLSALLGLWRGMVGEILALAAWVAAFLAARAWAAETGVVYRDILVDPVLRYAAGFATVFVAVLVLFAMGRLLLSMLLKAVGLGLTDRLLGGVFGVGRGVLMVLAGVLVAGLTPLPKNDWWQEASLAPPLETAAIAVRPWLPADVAKRIRYR